MVVFQYGSVVLFNVSDGNVDGYLKIVTDHASGLLPEIRKDGEVACQTLIFSYAIHWHFVSTYIVSLDTIIRICKSAIV